MDWKPCAFVILIIVSVDADCTGIILTCAKKLETELLNDKKICSSLRRYIHCYYPACNMDISYEDTAYNNVISAWSKYGITCDSTWSDMGEQFQDGSLLGGSVNPGLTTPRNPGSSLKTFSYLVFMFLSFLHAFIFVRAFLCCDL